MKWVTISYLSLLAPLQGALAQNCDGFLLYPEETQACLCYASQSTCFNLTGMDLANCECGNSSEFIPQVVQCLATRNLRTYLEAIYAESSIVCEMAETPIAYTLVQLELMVVSDLPTVINSSTSTSTATSLPTNQSVKTDGSQISIGAIVGISIALGLFVVGIILAITFYIIRHRRSRILARSGFKKSIMIVK
jgi:hypothetical protein